MKYPCLVLDHDDTVVNSTATIHHPAFCAYLREIRPGRTITLEDYLMKNFAPGFLPMCREEFDMSEPELEREQAFWRAYVQNHVPQAYPGFQALLQRHKQAGGLICVVSHSMRGNILRDYRENGLPEPDAVFGWDEPPEQRKPSPYPLQEIMRRFGLQPGQLLMVDDLKPGCDMARSCGVDFAGAGWAYRLPPVEAYLRANCTVYFDTVAQLAAYLQAVNG